MSSPIFPLLRITLFLLLLPLTVNAATLYSITDGGWYAAGTWSTSSGGSSCGCFPASTDDVVIDHVVTMAGSLANNGGITINASGTLVINGSFANNGIITINGGTLDLVDASTNNAGQINGSGTINCGGSFSGSGTVNGQSAVTCEDTQSILPIELIYFNVTKNGYMLDFSWATSSEVNNDFFTIETSQSTEVWDELKVVKGAGNSVVKKEYHVTGLSPKWSSAYYRLKQTDLDGQSSHSDWVKVSFYYQGLDDLFVYPNPINSNVNSKLRFNRAMPEGTRISVYTISGKHKFDQILEETTDMIELPSMDAGNYLVEIVGPSDVSRVKIVVK